MPSFGFPVRTDSSAYILLEDSPSERLEFQVFPEELSETKAADWPSVPIIGRAEPYKVYASSGSRLFTFTLGFFASVDEADQGTEEGVMSSVRFLRSLVYPDEIQGVVTPPPLCRLIVGDTINSRVITTNVIITYKGPWGLAPQSGELTLPHRAEATVSFEEVNTVPPTSSQVRAGALT